jgi:PAS domain S-box-containing protein
MSKASPLDESPMLTASALRVLELITDPFYVLDALWRIVYVNPPALAAFGRTLEEVEGLVLWDAYPTARDPVFHDHLQQVARERRGVTFEAQSPTLERWFEVRCHPCLDGVAVYLKDIHERKTAEQAAQLHSQALQAAERRLSLVLESIDDHLVSYDHQWRYTFVNDGAARVLGKSKEELLGHSIWELYPEAVGNPYWRDLHRAVADMRPITSEFFYRAWDKWFEIRIYPSSDGVTVFSSDITARKHREQALAERERALLAADQRKDEFLATLAHELRNPLAPIRQAAYIARSAQATAAQVRWSHDVVERQVNHMSRLLDDLLDVSRISRGTIQLRMEPVELGAVLDTAIETARPLIDARGHAFSVHDTCGPLRLEADANRLAQVVSNLLSNAAKYTDHGGCIELHAGLHQGQLELRVKDSGIGIAEKDLEPVFEMFTQIKSAIDRSEGGLGIGLALAKGIVELHGGSIEAHSEGLGQGSEFVLHLPVQARDALSGKASDRDAGLARQPLKVLVADDNADAAETLTLLLRLEGHAVQTANDGIRALELARDFHPDVALLDIGMPGLNGFEVAAAIRREPWARAARLIAITGWGKDHDKQRSKEAGFDEHLTKPVDPDVLKPLIARR